MFLYQHLGHTFSEKKGNGRSWKQEKKQDQQSKGRRAGWMNGLKQTNYHQQQNSFVRIVGKQSITRTAVVQRQGKED